MSEDGGFLSRWSRRKRAAGVPATPPPAAPAPPEAGPEGAATQPDAGPVFDPASLPPVESLTAESDFAAFLREEVPAPLRRAALRRAWTLDPAIRGFVGPADYAWDFNAPDGGMAGFSPELTGDLERLLAQAIGAGEAPAEGTPDGEGAPSTAMAGAPPLDSTPPDGQVGAPPAVASIEAPEASPTPDVLPAPAPPAAELPPARRRHGGALPA